MACLEISKNSLNCMNKKDERGIIVRNKARLVTQGHTQEEGIDYEDVFSPLARIEAIRLFLAYASFMGFMVYQMDVKSDFLYGTIKEEGTNTFSADGPSNTAVSLTHGKSSYMDPSQYLNEPNMPALKDINYSNDEEDVGVESDFTNLETNITVSPIPTTKVHKDHLVTQIIGDLSLATQTMSMKKVVKDQGGLSQINNEDFHTCMFAYFLSQEEPKRVHQALK
nr:copia protein [Tanacetum cinerariifolium]